jgi:hypothetical protein
MWDENTVHARLGVFRTWPLVVVFLTGVAPVHAEEDRILVTDEALTRAFRRGLSGSAEPTSLGNIHIKKWGNTYLFEGRSSKVGDSITLKCLLCTGDEALAKARSLGAKVSAMGGGVDPAGLMFSSLREGDMAYVDGIPLEPNDTAHSIEPGKHKVEIHRGKAVLSSNVRLEAAEEAELIVTSADYRQRARLRRQIALSGLGVTAAALGGVFLWLDGRCSSDKVDAQGDCEQLHELTGLGWGFIATGVLAEVAVLIWILAADDIPLIDKRAK